MAEEKNKKTKKPKTGNLSDRLYKLLVLVLMLGIFWNVYVLYKEFSGHGESADGDGRKLTYNVISGEINLANLKNKQDILEKGEAARKAEKNKNKTPEELEKEAEAAKKPDGSKPNQSKTPSAVPEDGEVGPLEANPNATSTQDYAAANLGVVITNLGLKQSNLDLAKTFPKEVAFSFSPYSRELQNKIRISRNEGREVLLGIEFESVNYPLTDSGPYTIHSFFEANQNIYRVQTTLALADNFIGMMSPYDEVITDKRDVITPIVEYLKNKNLFLAYARTPKNTALENDVKPLSANILIIDFYIDEDMTPDEVKDKLHDLKETLIAGKRAVVAITPYSAHLNELREWLKDNTSTKIKLAPISQFVTRN